MSVCVPVIAVAICVSFPVPDLTNTFRAVTEPAFFQATRSLPRLAAREARPGVINTRWLDAVVNDGLVPNAPAMATSFESAHTTCAVAAPVEPGTVQI